MTSLPPESGPPQSGLPQGGRPDEDPVGQLVARVGEGVIRAVVARFYQHVPQQPVLAPMYPEQDLQGAEERLADFLVQRFGGSQRYSETRGHPRLRMRHGKFQVDTKAIDAWIQCLDLALADTPRTDLPDGEREAMRAFLVGVAHFLRNNPN